ncbi:CCA tRNA nucleotidyltransferase [Lysinibacter sp. HNR]|uniref:CCA tRNA nucleotidyltransferase n=1 Tax=Lysinibacter sp. HNR TaxID=3031408 RepID=UPI002435FAC0|nr:CCA tRNA nucleotidyltransferase [Lysinibacter sp. HNR]WGD37332.1 CCA tRNA nucleotidyltransferase [Lysinibacter sp. HNR]
MLNMSDSVAALRSVAESPGVSVLSAAFAEANHELALVGGPVRDALLGRPVNDLDFATSASPDEILRIVKPHSSAQWDVGREFGTIAARVGDQSVEITTYRSDNYDSDSRKPEVVFGDSIEGDLRRRDFTVNAMALRLPEQVLVDPFGGVEDLLGGALRTPGTPEQSFSDDPLRMMRAARFASQLGFVVDASVRMAMESMRERLSIISQERIRDELNKLLCTDNPRVGLELLVDSGLMGIFLPEVPELKHTADDHKRHKDVYQHSLTVLDQAIQLEKERSTGPDSSPDLVVRLAALLHDIGKPSTRRFESGGVVTFHHHDVVGSKMSKKRLRALRYDNDTIRAVGRLVELHLRFFGYTDAKWSDSAVRRYVRDAGPELERLHVLVRADVTTQNVRKADRLAFAYDDLEDRIRILREQEELDAVRPDLNGEQIMKILNLTPGPVVGRAYAFLMELRLEEGVLGEEEATVRLREWARTERIEGVS